MALRSRLFGWIRLRSATKVGGGAASASPRVVELVRRAELAFELATRARAPAEPFLHGRADALACDLFAQSIHWSLRAYRDRAGANVTWQGGPPLAGGLWEACRDELLAAAGDERGLGRLREALVEKSFADFAEHSPSDAASLASLVGPFAERVLRPLLGERRRLERTRIRRMVWAVSALVALAVALLAVQSILAWNDERRDLARHATWTTSSTYPAGGCRSPAQVCAEGVGYFFHTLQEANPSIVFDLGRRRRVSSVLVDNRNDCCGERSVPLVVQVSDDQKNWRQVARRTEAFTKWRAEFSPVRARYVKLHLAGGAKILHLARVRILP